MPLLFSWVLTGAAKGPPHDECRPQALRAWPWGFLERKGTHSFSSPQPQETTAGKGWWVDGGWEPQGTHWGSGIALGFRL